MIQEVKVEYKHHAEVKVRMKTGKSFLSAKKRPICPEIEPERFSVLAQE
jgi:hypothetical protein